MEEEHGPAQHPVQDGEGTVQRHSLLVLGRRTCVIRVEKSNESGPARINFSDLGA